MRYVAAGGMTAGRGARHRLRIRPPSAALGVARRRRNAGIPVLPRCTASICHPGLPVANVPSGRAWGEVLRGVNTYTDLILLHLLETLEAKVQK